MRDNQSLRHSGRATRDSESRRQTEAGAESPDAGLRWHDETKPFIFVASDYYYFAIALRFHSSQAADVTQSALTLLRIQMVIGPP
jgi:hypothetical protein